MGLSVERPPASELYSRFVETGENGELVRGLWGQVPINFLEAWRLALRGREEISVPNSIETFKKEMKGQLREWGILTSKVEKNVDHLEGGVIESGHQPICLGGPSLILNKIACTQAISKIGEGGSLAPLFYVADYDGVQNELLNVRVPSTSPSGLLVSLPVGEELVGSPIHEVKNPPETWLRQTVDKVLSNYRGLLRGVEGSVRDEKLRNLEHALSILKSTYYSSENVSEWSTKLLGTLANVEADLGVPLLAFSTPGIRPLFQPGFEALLAEPNRGRFIESSNSAVEAIEGAGYRAQIGGRREDYVPFFIECMSAPCHRKRIEPRYLRREGSSTASVTGKCPSCGVEYDFSFDVRHPDLSELIGWISPRVDTRQIIVGALIPVVCHVGGPGEAGYYAEAAPAARSMNLAFPTFVRYTRVLYNTPWNEAQSTRLRAEGYRTLLNEEMFSALGRWTEARNSSEKGALADAHTAIREVIDSTFRSLLAASGFLKNDIDAMKSQLSQSTNRPTVIEEMLGKQKLLNVIDVYLSYAFGRFSPEKSGQEVSWSWLDLVTVSGVKDLFGTFLRQYGEGTPVSSMFFVNL